MAQITCARAPSVQWKEKYQPKLITVTSSRTSQRPRVSSSRVSSPRVRRVPAIQALAPASRTNTGAQKWVIQRVPNSARFVRAMSVGSKVTLVRKPRTWSSTMMTITSPRSRST